MKNLLTADGMRRYEQKIFAATAPIDVMETAAQGICDFIKSRFEKSATVCFVCGKGNNGGDGIAAARLLFNEGYDTEIILPLGEPKTDNAKENLEKAKKLDIPVIFDGYGKIDNCDAIVDAVFGIGFSGSANLECIRKINSCNAFKLAVDIPSGIDADTGKACGDAVKADATVTFGYAKPGLMQYPGKTFAGEIFVSKISTETPDQFDAFVPDDRYIKNLFPPFADDANKGDFGRLLVVAGSVGMTGAAYLTCMGALRSGCGLVTLAIPKNLNDIMEIKLTEAMTLPLDCDDKITAKAFEPLLADITRYDAVVIGPGLGKSDDVAEIIGKIVASGVPAVIDADGINSIGANINILQNAISDVVITPHPGEFARLTGKSIDEIQKNRLAETQAFAAKSGATVVLKGASTVVAKNGCKTVINPTGNRGMATGGSGDVLAGVIGALLAQGIKSADAATAGVYIHGASGDIAAKKIGRISLIASDIVHCLPASFGRITGE